MLTTVNGKVGLKYWWYRWASLAFTPQLSIAHWWSQADDGQVHLYREWIARNTPANQVGVELAKLTDPDAARITIWTSPELFEQGPHKPIAQQISEGIQQEYGPGTAFLYMSTYNEAGMPDAQQRVQALERRKAELQELRATLRPIVEDEQAGWEHLRELLRSRPFENEQTFTFDPDVARELAQHPDERLYADYMRACQRKPPVLPKMRIWSCCEQAIKALAGAAREAREPGKLGEPRMADIAEKSILYGVLAHRGGQLAEPVEAFRARRLALASEHTTDQAKLFMVGEKATWDFNKKTKQQKWRFPVIGRSRVV